MSNLSNPGDHGGTLERAVHRWDPRLYVRIFRELRRRIQAGDLAPGEPMPKISELAYSYDCSRDTVQSALKLLEKEGLVQRFVGLGYFVVPKQGDEIIDIETGR